MRRLLEMALLVLAACGGRIDDGTDASVDAAADSKGDVIMTPDTSPPPPCEPNGVACGSPKQCCSNVCSMGKCGGPTPPPSCKPDGVPCATDAECCSAVCNGTCGISVACATSSTKKCDQCVAMSCCKPMIDCQN